MPIKTLLNKVERFKSFIYGVVCVIMQFRKPPAMQVVSDYAVTSEDFS
ncbi:MAG: hypothetical protein KAT62_07115 [Desulfuromonadales bacterium]|nr:hypothetical protein [Desulfuromonadales bacterium]